MRIIIPKLNIPPQRFLKQAGYAMITNPHKNQEISYARSLDPGRFYPRFHAYLETDGAKIHLNLHLDMKKPNYEGTTAHSGEYEGKIVEEEKQRLEKAAEKFLFQNQNFPLGFQPQKSLLQKLLSWLKLKK